MCTQFGPLTILRQLINTYTNANAIPYNVTRNQPFYIFCTIWPDDGRNDRNW